MKANIIVLIANVETRNKKVTMHIDVNKGIWSRVHLVIHISRGLYLHVYKSVKNVLT